MGMYINNKLFWKKHILLTLTLDVGQSANFLLIFVGGGGVSVVSAWRAPRGAER